MKLSLVQKHLLSEEKKQKWKEIAEETGYFFLDKEDRVSDDVAQIIYANGIKFDEDCRRFNFLDNALIVLENWKTYIPQIDIIKKDYPQLFPYIEEFAELLTESDRRIETYRERMLKEHFRLHDNYDGSTYYERYPDRKPTVDGTMTWDSTENGAFQRTAKKIGRNDPCPCGSGKKYKQCCGRK